MKFLQLSWETNKLYINENFGIQLNMDKLDFDAFTSLNTLADLVLAENAEKRSS